MSSQRLWATIAREAHSLESRLCRALGGASVVFEAFASSASEMSPVRDSDARLQLHATPHRRRQGGAGGPQSLCQRGRAQVRRQQGRGIERAASASMGGPQLGLRESCSGAQAPLKSAPDSRLGSSIDLSSISKSSSALTRVSEAVRHSAASSTSRCRIPRSCAPIFATLRLNAYLRDLRAPPGLYLHALMSLRGCVHEHRSIGWLVSCVRFTGMPIRSRRGVFPSHGARIGLPHL